MYKRQALDGCAGKIVAGFTWRYVGVCTAKQGGKLLGQNGKQMCIRDRFMRLSPVTRANLELTETLRGREKRGTLLWVLDKTCLLYTSRCV